MVIRKFRRVARLGRVVGTGLALTACHPSPVEVDAATLDVRAAIARAEIAASARPSPDSVQVTVSVTNPRRRAVVVQLGGPPYRSGNIPAAETHGVGFGVRVVAADGGPPRGPSTWTWGQPAVTLGARQTLRHTVTIRAAADDAGEMTVTPGRYRVIASFGKQEAAPLDLNVRP
jgi:hypothetical protein